MRIIVRLFPTALMVLIVAAASIGSAGEGKRAWSQPEVVALTEQLSAALDELLSDPGLREPQASAYQQRNHEAAIATVKEMRPRVAELHKRVASSSDIEVSRPYFELVAELREEISGYAEQSWLPDATRENVLRIRGLFRRLAHYYE